jgi:predicted Zn-dependent protease
LLRGCLCCAALAATGCVATEPTSNLAPGYRPDSATLEGGLWRAMQREEARIADSPNRIRDPAVTGHVEEVVRRLAGEHAADIRVYVVRAPGFNASMAPNGMMQVWSGLLLRTQTESQLATVLGHEVAHYTRRHTLARFQQARGAADVAALLGLGGVAGLVVGVAAMAGVASFSREQEAEADALGLAMLNTAGYVADDAPGLWENLLAEARLRPEGNRLPLFATHPASDQRAAALREAAATLPAASRGTPRPLRTSLRGIRQMLFADELRLGQYAASVELFRQAEAAGNADGPLYTAWGEALRLRNEAGDADLALATFRRATTEADAPPEAWRGLGLVLRRQGDRSGAQAAFRTYLARAPRATDAALIQSYLDEAGA